MTKSEKEKMNGFIREAMKHLEAAEDAFMNALNSRKESNESVDGEAYSLMNFVQHIWSGAEDISAVLEGRNCNSEEEEDSDTRTEAPKKAEEGK